MTSIERSKIAPLRLTARFRKAMVYAACLHEGQGRKGTTRPYVGHLLGVTALVLQHGGDEDQAIAALLHDAVEDQGGLITLDAIRRKFGERVAQLVEGCTDSFITPKPAWRERKLAYIAHTRSATADVRLIAAADKLYNVREILQDYRQAGDAVWSRFAGAKEGSLWYYREMVQAFSDAGAHAAVDELVEELERTLRELERLASV
jgi:(p)ppGpp synthase/HD superfamily hydrolase